jgi:hypothetical protein
MVRGQPRARPASKRKLRPTALRKVRGLFFLKTLQGALRPPPAIAPGPEACRLFGSKCRPANLTPAEITLTLGLVLRQANQRVNVPAMPRGAVVAVSVVSEAAALVASAAALGQP